jgi:hypothetical protein
MPATAEKKLADDLLVGGDAIADYTGLDRRQIYYQAKNLGLKRLGALLVGSKAELTKLLTGRET